MAPFSQHDTVCKILVSWYTKGVKYDISPCQWTRWALRPSSWCRWMAGHWGCWMFPQYEDHCCQSSRQSDCWVLHQLGKLGCDSNILIFLTGLTLSYVFNNLILLLLVLRLGEVSFIEITTFHSREPRHPTFVIINTTTPSFVVWTTSV